MGWINDPIEITNAQLVRRVRNADPNDKTGEAEKLYEFDSGRDLAAYESAIRDDSHKKFFDGRKNIMHVEAPGDGSKLRTSDGTIAEMKQSAKRKTAIEEVVQNLVRVQPGSGMHIERVSWKQFEKLMSDYRVAIATKETHDSALARVGFQPTQVYMNKLLLRSDGTARTKPVRNLLQHEVGIRPNGTIVCLEDRFPGDVGTLVVAGSDIGSKASPGTPPQEGP